MNKNLFTIGLCALFMSNVGHTYLSTSPLDIHDEQTIQSLMPSFMIDTWGFHPSEENPFMADIGNNEIPKIYPFFPITKKSGFLGMNKKVIGVKVPGKYISSDSFKAKQQKIEAANYIKKINVGQALKLIPYEYKGEIYGIRNDYRVSRGSQRVIGISLNSGSHSGNYSSTTYGISIGLGIPNLFKENKTVTFGDKFVLGLDLNLSGRENRIGDLKGINLAESFYDVIDTTKGLIPKGKGSDYIDMSLLYSPFIQSQLVYNYRNSLKEITTPKTDLFKIHKRGLYNFEYEPENHIKVQPEGEDYSKEIRSLRSKLDSRLEKEVDWKKKIKKAVGSTQIIIDKDANIFMQHLCDHISNALKMPKKIWPKCHIAGTMTPNAWAYPGGDIFVSAGLIGVLTSLDGLLFVLAHEIGHVFARHTTRAMPGRHAVAYSANFLSHATNIFTMMAGGGTLGSVSFANYFPKMMATSFASGYALMLPMYAGMSAIMAHSRANEKQSDRIGHEFALSVGADANGLVQGWKDFSEFFKTYMPLRRSFFKRLIESHPDSYSRLRKLEKRAKKLNDKFAKFQINKLPFDFYKRYASYHSLYRDPTHQWGQQIKDKIEKENKTKTEKLNLEYKINSMLAPGGRCGIHIFFSSHDDH